MEEKEIEVIGKITKPEFIGEIKAEIKGLAEIEHNISEVKEYAHDLNNYYSKIIWSQETLKEAKDEKSNINKFKNSVADFRKNILADFKKPIELFETTAKETEKLLAETYETINLQVKKFEDETKEIIRKNCENYFNEYASNMEIDFVEFEKMNLNITLGSAGTNLEPKKAVKEEIEKFLMKIINDLELINIEEENKVEILTEYKKTLDVSNSILNVKKRIKAIEEEKRIQEELLKTKTNINSGVEKVIAAVGKTTAPIEVTETEIDDKKYKMSFEVIGTKEQLKELKAYLIEKELLINE